MKKCITAQQRNETENFRSPAATARALGFSYHLVGRVVDSKPTKPLWGVNFSFILSLFLSFSLLYFFFIIVSLSLIMDSLSAC